MTKLLFADVETTGLHPEHDAVWEIGAYKAEVHDRFLVVSDSFHCFVQLGSDAAERMASIPEKYLEDYRARYSEAASLSQSAAGTEFAFWVDQGCHLVGANPTFDDRFLLDIMPMEIPDRPWDYHLICIENLIAGKLMIPAPWPRSNEMARQVGVDSDSYRRHTALGDCMWAVDVYAAVYGLEMIEEGAE